ncbi:MAG: hypothetical protein JSV68_03910, partial [Anaerolineaceae bacterium]
MKKSALITAIILFTLLTACSVANNRSNLQTAATAAADVQATLDDATIATIESQETPIFVTSTPSPTKEPGVVDEAVSTVASATNLDQITFLGLTGEDWINVIVSILTIFVGYLITTFVFMRSLRWLVRKTPTQFDDAFLDTIHGPLRFFVLVLFVQLSLLRLTFLDEDVVR